MTRLQTVVLYQTVKQTAQTSRMWRLDPLKLIRMEAQLERFDPARMWIQMLARCGKQDTRPRKQGYLPSTILFVQQLGEAEQSCSRCSGRRPFGRSCMT